MVKEKLYKCPKCKKECEEILKEGKHCCDCLNSFISTEDKIQECPICEKRVKQRERLETSRMKLTEFIK